MCSFFDSVRHMTWHDATNPMNAGDIRKIEFLFSVTGGVSTEVTQYGKMFLINENTNWKCGWLVLKFFRHAVMQHRHSCRYTCTSATILLTSYTDWRKCFDENCLVTRFDWNEKISYIHSLLWNINLNELCAGSPFCRTY